MSTETAQRRLLTMAEVAASLGGIARSTVYDLINAGELVKVSIGRRSFVPVESLDAYVGRITRAAVGQ